MFSRSKKAGGRDLSGGPPMPDYFPPQFVTKPREVRIYVNGRALRVDSSKTVLQACRDNGIEVPTLCHHPMVRPTGRCGVCVVHIEGRDPPLQKACKTHVVEDMVITTNTPEVLYQSQANLREFLGAHRIEDLCKSKEIEDLDRLVKEATTVDDNEQEKHQYAIVRDQSACISCTRCVRECGEVQNMNILYIDPNRPHQPIAFDGDLPLHETNCIACGQCTSICPTGAVSERQDWPKVMAELKRSGPDRKIIVIQTAPAARLSVGELFGDETPTSPEKTVAALHAMGFNYVFDTTFTADTTALLEAEELVERMKADGPWPMFTSCCPAWVMLIEKKYPHLRPLLSRCKSPMMMMGTMIRCWMKKNNIPREKYFSVALMPCTAKKEEILKPELRDPEGNHDVDVVLTAREMGRLIKAMGIKWSELPGKYNSDYDEPFGKSSGGGALFPVGGGVTEAALRAAYTMFTNEVLHDPERCVFEAVRKTPAQIGEYISAEINVTPDRRHKRPLEGYVINGTRAIQQFLESSGIDTPEGSWTGKGNVFVECMSCPGGCVNGGGQPHSLDPDIVSKRRKAVHKVDKKNEFITTVEAQKDFSATDTLGIKSIDEMHELMEYDPPDLSQNHFALRAKSNSESGYGSDGDKNASRANNASMSRGGSSTSGTGLSLKKKTRKTTFSTHDLGQVCILYGSQAGFTASFAKKMYSVVNRAVADEVTVHSMDQFDMELLKNCSTVILLSSTWESDKGLMPSNAVKFWNWLKARDLQDHRTLFAKTRFAVCGFGSTKYRYFCGFASKLHEMFLRLGSFPIVDLVKVDVDKPDRGQKQFTGWEHDVLRELQAPTLPEPNVVLLPSVSQNMKMRALPCPDGFKVLKVNALLNYKKMFSGGDHYFYLELSADGSSAFADPPPDQYLYILPRNDPSRVEKLVNNLYPGMANTVVSLVSVGKMKSKDINEVPFPPSLSIKELFEYYIDLSAHPAWHFVMQMESLMDESSSSMTSIIENNEAFCKWSSSKTYFDVLQQYSSVVPSIEVLITMLPRMLPRCYAPLIQDHRRDCIAIMFKLIPNGTCTTYMKGLKRGDKVIAQLGTSEFACRIDDLTQPFQGLGSSRSSHKEATKAMATHKQIPLAELPLTLNITELFGDLDRKPNVDETINSVFTITNMQKDKYRFTLAGTKNERFRLSFEPSSGVVKSKFSAQIKVALTVFCTCDVLHNVLITCEPITKHIGGSSDDGMISSMIPIHVESKLSPKLDFNEIKFLDEIGSGSYGTVSRGIWRGQDVAVKLLKTDRVDVKEFQNECQLLQELRCPYVVNFVGYCLSRDRFVLLTEFMELGSLGKYIHNDLTIPYKVRVSLDCARGMAFLHNCGMMHRDLKPDNLLVASLEPSEKVVVKLADFGTSCEVSTKELTSAKKMTGGVGTPIYMAPEVLEGGQYSAAADVFSFAMLMFELFTSKEPYLTPEFTAPWHIAQFVAAGKRLDIPDTVPKAIADLVRMGWAHDPFKRPSFETFVEELNKIWAREGSKVLSRHVSTYNREDPMSPTSKARKAK